MSWQGCPKVEANLQMSPRHTCEAGGVELPDIRVQLSGCRDEVLHALIQQAICSQLCTDLLLCFVVRHKLAPRRHVHTVDIGVSHWRACTGQVDLKAERRKGWAPTKVTSMWWTAYRGCFMASYRLGPSKKLLKCSICCAVQFYNASH